MIVDLKKKMKAFFTLKRRADDGFTLVELIVVIAILAILGGVAVPVYSGYVTKANMAADQALVGEVAHGLTLYYYNTPGIEGGYVVLTSEGQVCSSDEGGVGDAAMVAVFGEGWEENLSLKYDGWTKAAGNTTVASWNPEDVARTVTGVTGLANIATAGNNTTNAINVLKEFLPGIEEELTGYAGHEDFATIATNLMVKYVADEMAGIRFKMNEDGSFAGTTDYIYVTANGEEASAGTNFAVRYAMLHAMANDAESDYQSVAAEKLVELNEALEKLAKDESENPSGTRVTAGLNEIWNTLNNTGLQTAMYLYIEDEEKGESALAGIGAAMDAVNSVAKDYRGAETLSKKELFNAEMVANSVKYYQIANQNGGVVVYIDAKGNADSMPKVS